ASLMIDVFSTHPVVMTAIYLDYALFCFAVMTRPRKLFMYGAMCLAVCSGLVHYGSYPEMAWQQLLWAIAGSLACSVVLYVLSFALYPDGESRAPRIPPKRIPTQRRHFVLLCALGATGSFAFFQLVEMSYS